MADGNDANEGKGQPSAEKIEKVNRSVKIALSVSIPLGLLLVFIIVLIALKFKNKRDSKKTNQTENQNPEDTPKESSVRRKELKSPENNANRFMFP